MKTLLFISLLTLIACSRDTGNSSGQSLNLSNADYLLATANDDADYNSTETTLVQIQDGYLVFMYGLANAYDQNPDGSPRGGNHPESEFRMQAASYKLSREGDNIKLEFQNSSCKDSSKNPFAALLPNTMTMEQLESALKVKLDDTEVSYPKDTANQGATLMSSNVVRVLCEGESND